MSSITNLISVGVNGTGTANSVMKWLDADTATDSIITDNGSTVSISGDLSATNIAGTLSTAAQPNITSVGTLSSLAVSGASTLNGNVEISKSSPILKLTAPIGTAGEYQIANSVGTSLWSMFSVTGGGDSQGNFGLYSLGKTGGAGTVLEVTPSGNVGIGTSSPDNKIHILTAAGTQSAIQLGQVARGTAVMGMQSSAAVPANFVIGTDVTGEIIFKQGVSPLDLSTGTERMRISSTGNVGIGDSTPATKVSISSGTAAVPAVRIVGAGGNQGWLRLGDWADIQGGGDYLGMLFSTSNVERMRITSAGEVLIGTTTAGGAGSGLQLINFSGTSGSIAVKKTASGQLSAIANFHNGSYVGGVDYSDTATIFATSSDYRLKEDLQPIANPLDRISVLNPINFAWKLDGSRVDGFLAHEVAEVVPEAVTGQKDAVDKDGKPIYQSIDQSKLVPLLVGAIQELRAEIETLKSQINA